MKIPPLVLLVLEKISLRKILFNRITLVVLVAVVLTIGMQGYISANNDGNIQGTVIDADGEPVEDAVVVLSEERRLGQNPSHETTTNANGEFAFTGLTEVLEFRLYAEAPDGQESEEYRIHLNFQGQNYEQDIVFNESSS